MIRQHRRFNKTVTLTFCEINTFELFFGLRKRVCLRKRLFLVVVKIVHLQIQQQSSRAAQTSQKSFEQTGHIRVKYLNFGIIGQ